MPTPVDLPVDKAEQELDEAQAELPDEIFAPTADAKKAQQSEKANQGKTPEKEKPKKAEKAKKGKATVSKSPKKEVAP